MNIACGSNCMYPITLNYEISATKCGHLFYSNCITKWLRTGKKTCPVCRKSCTMTSTIKLYISADETVKEEDASQVESEALKFEIKSFTDWVLHDDPNIEAGVLLQWAAGNGHLNIYRSITEELPDKNPKDNEGWTPLHEATSKSHEAVANLILNLVEDKNPKNNVGRTPLHYVAQKGLMDTCTMIVQHVMEKNPKDENGTTPTSCSCWRGSLPCIQTHYGHG
jgi:hypothetical protein